MRQRKDRVRLDQAAEEQGEGNERGIAGKEFYACYLLCSLSPRHKGQTYIGFTINPRRRIRQHNGEINCGAWRTKTKRPWEMVFCIYGFPSQVSALQFEWAWQHPKESLAVRKAAAEFKSLSGVANKIKLAYTMLNLPEWQSLNLIVNFFSTKYMKHTAGCPSLPVHMKAQICPMEELPCYMEAGQILEDNEDDWEAENGSDSASVVTLMGKEVYNFAKHHCGIETTAAYIETRRIEEDNHFGEPRSSFTLKGDYRFPVCSGDFSRTRSPSTKESVGDGSLNEWIQEFDGKSDQPSKLLTAEAADNDQSPSTDGLISSEVEMINLLTPSPVSILRSCHKRASSVFPKFIDLTESPVSIHL